MDTCDVSRIYVHRNFTCPLDTVFDLSAILFCARENCHKIPFPSNHSSRELIASQRELSQNPLSFQPFESRANCFTRINFFCPLCIPASEQHCFSQLGRYTVVMLLPSNRYPAWGSTFIPRTKTGFISKALHTKSKVSDLFRT